MRTSVKGNPGPETRLALSYPRTPDQVPHSEVGSLESNREALKRPFGGYILNSRRPFYFVGPLFTDIGGTLVWQGGNNHVGSL